MKHQEDKPRLDHQHALEHLKGMMRIRRFEDRCAELYTQQKIHGFLHLYDGEEAIAQGVLPVLSDTDRIVATYREHGHAIVRGMSLRSVMAELYGKSEGCSGGRGGSMHLFSHEHLFYGGNAIVGGGLPLAVGLALADQMSNRHRVTVCFFGEGAVAEGEFHESMNLAALWALPVLFVCENNGYAMGTPLSSSESTVDISRKAAAYGIDSEAVDGMDVVTVEAASRRAISAIKANSAPRLLECRTYRFRGHSMFDTQLYRDKEEVHRWRERGPIVRFQSWLEDNGIVHSSEISELISAIDLEIEDAVAYAEAGTPEPVSQLMRYVTAEQEPVPSDFPDVVPDPNARQVETTYREAVRAAIDDALRRDNRVFLMGEDVGRYGGCYAVSKGLFDVFGEQRIRDTPLSESGFTGAGIGAAMAGMRPIVELMTVNFSLLALDQILNTAATIRHMSNNQFSVPLVIRMATGAGRQLAAQHSHSLEGWYAHIPGLRVLAPATLEDARGMLWTALEDPDPVLIFENVMLYNRSGSLSSAAGPVDIDKAKLRREGSDVSLITYGGSLFKTLDAASELASQGIEADVVDLRCLRPLDMHTVAASVRKTRRGLIVDEGWRSGSLSAEIGMRLAEAEFFELDAPLSRVCAEEVPTPYAEHLEHAAIPQTTTIVSAVQRMFGLEVTDA